MVLYLFGFNSHVQLGYAADTSWFTDDGVAITGGGVVERPVGETGVLRPRAIFNEHTLRFTIAYIIPLRLPRSDMFHTANVRGILGSPVGILRRWRKAYFLFNLSNECFYLQIRERDLWRPYPARPCKAGYFSIMSSNLYISTWSIPLPRDLALSEGQAEETTLSLMIVLDEQRDVLLPLQPPREVVDTCIEVAWE